MTHEVLGDLFKNRPSLAPEILEEVLDIPLPDYTEAHVASIDLTQIQPAEYRADAVIVLRHGQSIVRVVIVEIQLGKDFGKRLSWPVYITVSRALHDCPATLLVVTPDPALAGWCAEPIETGTPGFVLRPPVLHYTAVPVVTDPEEAARRPELAVLSAMAHGESEQGASIGAAVLEAIRRLDDDRAKLYYDLVYNSLNDLARRELETIMKGYEYQSDFAKKFVAEGITQGLAEGITQGRAEGITQGRAEGITQGRAQEAARNLLAVFRARGFVVPDVVRERILAQQDPDRLERWLEKAVVASSLDSALDEIH